MVRILLATLLLFGFCSTAAANHSELEWFTVETDHFIVHYHAGAEQTARRAAEIAEAIYEPVTRLYDFEPPTRTHFVLADYEDYANGAAYFFDGKFEIWATNLEFDLRGTTQWLWNVITHEFVHLVNIQSSQRTPTNIPAVYFQWFDYERERRTDVLNGYPNVLVSYPYSGVMVPAWFAEGTAQYMVPNGHHDFWDAHRDMIVRMAALDDALLGYDELSLFKGSLAAEQVYDHGFSIVRYIAREHGAESLRDIINGMRSKTRLSANGAFKKATGMTGRQLHEAWERETKLESARRAEMVEPTEQMGRPLGTSGTYNVRPVFSPDGKKLAWLSSLGGDYHRTALVMRSVDPADSSDAKLEVIAGGVSSHFSFSADGKTIYYAKRATKDRFGSVYYDLFAYDVEEEEETRLTRGARLRDPAVSPDGRRIAAVRNRDGTNDIAIVALPAEKERAEVTIVTESPFGRQYYAPTWHPDGSHILVDRFDTGIELDPKITRDVVTISPEDGREGFVIRSPSDDRTPVYTPGGRSVIYAVDGSASGYRKFDLFERDLETGETTQLTNVLGGAFYPSVSPDGETIAYSAYTSDGYRIYLLSRDEALTKVVTDFPALEREPTTVRREPIESWEEKPYKGRFGRFLWSPRVVIDEGRVKLGIYASTNDVLDKQSIFGGAAYGQKGDLDAFILYENRFFWPTIFAEAFWIRKNRTDTTFSKLEGLERKWDLDLRYDAFEIDAGLRLEAGSPFSPFFYSSLEGRFRHSRNHLNLRVTKLTPSDDLIDEGDVLILPKDGWDYYRGYDFILSYQRRVAARTVDAEINPAGREISIAYTYSRNDLSTSGNQEVDASGVIRTIFDKNNFHQLEGSLTERRRMPWGGRHTLELTAMGGWIDRNVDDFFWFRTGSRPGLRGYTFYSLEGRAYAIGRATLRFPIANDIDRRFLQFIAERLYGGVFYEAGVTWKRPVWSTITWDQIVRNRVRDVGFELRLDMLNFDTFPARVHFEGAYPIDRVTIPSAVADAADDDALKTDRDWKFYFGVLFGY